MEKYTIKEKTQFVKWYFAGNSLNQVRDLFSALYPDRPIPSKMTISRVINQFNESGSVFKPCKNCQTRDDGNEANRNYNENKLNVILAVTENPNNSVRQISSDLNIHFSTVHKILKDEKYHSYKFSRHQEIFERDKINRSEFCELIMDMANRDRTLLKNICFTDESTFTLNGEPNVQNNRCWSKDNPHLLIATHTQYPQKVNVWAGILGTHIIGPFFIEGNLNSEKYLELLQNQIGPEVERYSAQNDATIWFQHDGCPAHNGQDIKIFLNQCFPNSWIGRGGTINWPARSPDLAPNDFFCGHI